MHIEEFKEAVKKPKIPELENNDLLKALWFDANDDWSRAHSIVQRIPTKMASRIHAYLHRKEGDMSNASYWYHHARVTYPTYSFDEEWGILVELALDSN
ncbi:MAG TPA: hypothetical protein VE912_01845 [Bacteroidales bacterium]|nr:hypothetical protein [Bacteroidales bacterium]